MRVHARAPDGVVGGPARGGPQRAAGDEEGLGLREMQMQRGSLGVRFPQGVAGGEVAAAHEHGGVEGWGRGEEFEGEGRVEEGVGAGEGGCFFDGGEGLGGRRRHGWWVVGMRRLGVVDSVVDVVRLYS